MDLTTSQNQMENGKERFILLQPEKYMTQIIFT